MKKAVSVLFMCILSLPAFANTNENMLTNIYAGMRPYVGFDFAYNDMVMHDKVGDDVSIILINDIDHGIETDDLISSNYIGFGVNMGIQFSNYLGVEGFFHKSYAKPKTTEFSRWRTSIPFDREYYKIQLDDLETMSFGSDVLCYLPLISKSVSILGTLGIGYYRFKLSSRIDKTLERHNELNAVYKESEEESNIGFRCGVGGQYNFSEHMAVRLIARFVEINSDKNDDIFDNMIDISIGLKYTF